MNFPPMPRLLSLTATLAFLLPLALAVGDITSREFHADLSAYNQTRLTESPATGKADFFLDLTDLTLTWTVEFEDLLSTPVAASLHGPAQPGANGLAFVDLAPQGINSPLTGSAVLTEAEVQYLLMGWTYVNITTEKFPYGEARGQVDVGPRLNAPAP